MRLNKVQRLIAEGLQFGVVHRENSLKKRAELLDVVWLEQESVFTVVHQVR